MTHRVLFFPNEEALVYLVDEILTKSLVDTPAQRFVNARYHLEVGTMKKLSLVLLVCSFGLTAMADTFDCRGRTRQDGLDLTFGVKASYDTEWGDGRNIKTLVVSEGTKTEEARTLLTRAQGEDILTGKQGKRNTTIYTDPTGAEVRKINRRLGTDLKLVNAAVLELVWEPTQGLKDGQELDGFFYFELGADREQALKTNLKCTWKQTPK
jgi:hypothetical protein